jgi:hypothetical protein
LIYVDGDYRGRAAYPRRHDCAETDRTGAEGDETRTGMDVQRLEHCARARLDAAAGLCGCAPGAESSHVHSFNV